MGPHIGETRRRAVWRMKMAKHHKATNQDQPKNCQNFNQGEPELNLAEQFYRQQIQSQYKQHTARTDQRLPYGGKPDIGWQPET